MGEVQQGSLALQRFFEAAATGHILKGEEDQGLPGAEAAGIQKHDAFADALKIVADFKIVDANFVAEDAIQELAEPGNIPLPITEIQDATTYGLRRQDLEGFVKGRIGYDDIQIGVQNQNGFAGGFDQRIGVGAGIFDDPLEGVDILKSDDRAFNFVLGGLVGAR